MKHLVFSFDDGRLDTYTEAMPIMEECGIRGVINIIPEFTEAPQKYSEQIIPTEAMTPEMIRDAHGRGHEIACHGYSHKNSVEDIRKGIQKLSEWGIPTEEIGFASPFSYISDDNKSQLDELIRNHEISYIRSGDQARREGPVFLAAYLLSFAFHSPGLFWLMNRRHLCKNGGTGNFIRGISVTRHTTLRQIESFVRRMKDHETAVLIFHSILPEESVTGNTNRWIWSAADFRSLCAWMEKQKDCSVVLQKDIL